MKSRRKSAGLQSIAEYVGWHAAQFTVCELCTGRSLQNGLEFVVQRRSKLFRSKTAWLRVDFC